MSGGYTPLFSSLTTGTLCGRWPDIGLWPIVLSLANQHGVVDVTCEYIARVTGLALPDVEGCMQRFCQPDPHSRSDVDGGARLALLDTHRTWGWRVINHGLYREKARLMAKAAREIDSGVNATRMLDRRGPPLTAADRRGPPLTAADRRGPPLTPSTNSNSNSNSNSEETHDACGTRPARVDVASGTWDVPHGTVDEAFLEFKLAYPERNGDYRWREARSAINARLREGHTWEEIISGAKRYAAWCEATGKTGTERVKQAATFCGTDKPFLEPWGLPKPSKPAYVPPKTVAELEAEERTRG